MHLLKVQERLKARQYRTVEQVLDHIQLIWDNCKEYNQSGVYIFIYSHQPFYTLADKMERNFKKMIKNYLPNIQIIIPSSISKIYIIQKTRQTPNQWLPQPRLLPISAKNHNSPAIYRCSNRCQRSNLSRSPKVRKIVSTSV